MKLSIYILDYSDKLDYYRLTKKGIFNKPKYNKYKQNFDNNVQLVPANAIEIFNFFNNINLGINYRINVYNYLSRTNEVFVIKLVPLKKEIIDYEGNKIASQLTWEHIELDNLMSWFSTLGGAFSSLGDNFQHCAEMAGKISMQQLKLAFRLGDPLVMARCKLYYSISLIQKGQLRRAKHLIREQYELAVAQKEIDIRLMRMCLGIWSKLQYTYKLRKHSKMLEQI